MAHVNVGKYIYGSPTCMKLTLCIICFSYLIIATLRMINDIHPIRSVKDVAVETTRIYHMVHYDTEDDGLVTRLNSSLIQPTHTHYQLSNPLPVREHLLEREVRQLYPGQRGFFVEVGAGDGEYRSPTLCLEAEDGWSGLLIEANSSLSEMLMKKQRKVLVAPACVGSKNFSYVGYQWSGRVFLEKPRNTEPLVEVQCYPLYTYFLAARLDKVELLVVNINGGELEVLRTLPWTKVIITVLAVGFNNPVGKKAIQTYVSKVGYRVHKVFSYMDESFIMFKKVREERKRKKSKKKSQLKKG